MSDVSLQLAIPDEKKKKPYVLAEAYGRANIQSALYYVMTELDKTTVPETEQCCFGDKVYVIETGNTYILGNNGNWYPYCIPGLYYNESSTK